MIQGDYLRYGEEDDQISVEDYLNFNFHAIENYIKNGGKGNANLRMLSKAEYDLLPDSKYNDGVMYFVVDYTENVQSVKLSSLHEFDSPYLSSFFIGETVTLEEKE